MSKFYFIEQSQFKWTEANTFHYINQYFTNLFNTKWTNLMFCFSFILNAMHYKFIVIVNVRKTKRKTFRVIKVFIIILFLQMFHYILTTFFVVSNYLAIISDFIFSLFFQILIFFFGIIYTVFWAFIFIFQIFCTIFYSFTFSSISFLYFPLSFLLSYRNYISIPSTS